MESDYKRISKRRFFSNILLLTIIGGILLPIFFVNAATTEINVKKPGIDKAGFTFYGGIILHIEPVPFFPNHYIFAYQHFSVDVQSEVDKPSTKANIQNSKAKSGAKVEINTQTKFIEVNPGETTAMVGGLWCAPKQVFLGFGYGPKALVIACMVPITAI